jgi:PTH1 family peptidyl-tRNA hydrolase
MQIGHQQSAPGKLIVGLGNPGRQYVRTRHNAGFMVVDRLAERWRISLASKKKFQARLALLEKEGTRLLLCEPDTFMNASGQAVQEISGFYRITPENILPLVDDANLPLGEIRLRARGSSGGHHGIESIEQHLGTREFPRLRIGIGREASGAREITDYVLSQFSKEEAELLERVLTRACEQVECWLHDGLLQAMNRFNGKVNILE